MNKPVSGILVTAVGALIGQGIVRSLRGSGGNHRIIGIDRSSNLYGESIVDTFYRKPCKESNPDYLPWLQAITERENIGLILPGIEEDVFFFHDSRIATCKWPVRIAINSLDAISAGRDKWVLHEQMQAHGMPVIPTTVVSGWGDFVAALGQPPYIVKARRGSGSRGQMVFKSEDEWSRERHKYDGRHMVQRVVGTDDEEYTVALFGLGGGVSTGFFVMKRRLWNGGTWQAEVVDGDQALEQSCASLNRLLKPEGPTNYQFRRENGVWYLLEINPRLSASTAIRAGFGFNEAAMCVQYYLDGQTPVTGAMRRGYCQRFVTEHFDYT